MVERKIRLSWVDTNSRLAETEIERSDTGDLSTPIWGVIAVILVDVTEHVDIIVASENGVNYFYRIRHKISIVYGSYSDPVGVFVQNIVVNAPTGFSATLLPLGS